MPMCLEDTVRKGKTRNTSWFETSGLIEIARVLERLDQVARSIVNTNHSAVSAAAMSFRVTSRPDLRITRA